MGCRAVTTAPGPRCEERCEIVSQTSVVVSPLDGYTVRSLRHKSHSPTSLRLHLGSILVSGSTRLAKMALAVGHDGMQPPNQ